MFFTHDGVSLSFFIQKSLSTLTKKKKKKVFLLTCFIQREREREQLGCSLYITPSHPLQSTSTFHLQKGSS
jgi:hypothetical protein